MTVGVLKMFKGINLPKALESFTQPFLFVLFPAVFHAIMYPNSTLYEIVSSWSILAGLSSGLFFQYKQISKVTNDSLRIIVEIIVPICFLGSLVFLVRGSTLPINIAIGATYLILGTYIKYDISMAN